MLHKSMLGLPMLLLGASCVPPVAGGQGVRTLAAAMPARPAEAPAGKAPAPLPPAEAIAPGQAAEPFAVGAAGERDIAASLQCLTAAVYHEARSEGLEGQRAVAQVVLNRVRHSAFPNSVCAVVYQGSRRSTGCQFSFTCDGSLRRALDREAWLRARRVATTALAGGVYGPVGLATHYHTTAIRPWWASAMRPAVIVGSHIFYRWRGEWGDPKSYRRPYLAAETTRLAERPAQREAPAAAPAQGDVTMAFGVRIRRGGPPPRMIAAEAATPAAPEETTAVRIRVGLPDFVEAAAAEPAGTVPAAR
ncbi:MAG TPA: cell wall hydrolase [Allosphingosinicella sp.]|jgi:spore germination cell wall hydrolase CwlJ-like protein